MAKKNAKKAAPIDHERMLECVRSIKAMEQAKKELESDIKAYKQEVQGVMTKHGLEEMICDVFTVRFKDVSSERLDSKALKEQCRGIYDRFLKTIVSKRFTID